MYENIEKLIEISALNENYVNDNNEFQTICAVDKVNKLLSNGWKLLAINSCQSSENASQIQSYILGFPKSDSPQ